MALPIETAEQISEQLYDFNPNLKVKIVPGENQVVATIDKLKMCGEELQTLAEITKGWSVTMDRSGANFRMTIY